MVIYIILTTIIISFFTFYLRKIRRDNSNRINFENALKFIFKQNRNNISVNFTSIKGHLELSDKRTLEIIQHLLDSQLITQNNHDFFVSDEGKDFAVNIIRNHRLWEKYLAEETGIHELNWHSEAEKKEHNLSEIERNHLIKKLGNPLRDPHGDPIPTESGQFFKLKSIPLSQINEPINLQILHIEDEPKEIYSQILKIGLLPNSKIKIEKVDKKFWFAKTEFGDIQIPKSVGTNISIQILDEEIEFEKNLLPLSQLQIGQKAVIKNISSKLRGLNRRRLLDFGFIPGAEVSLSFENFANDPRAYEIKKTLVALRNSISENILVSIK